MFSHIDTAPSKNRTWKPEMPMSNGIIILPVHILAFFVLQTKALQAHHNMQRLTRPEIQIKIRFQSGFQALVDMRSHKLA
jgi:hypothetical protein